MFVPDSDLDFLPILDPGVKKALDRGSATLRETKSTSTRSSKDKKLTLSDHICTFLSTVKVKEKYKDF